jgi:ABC-2 type transport system permease protein
MGWDLLLLWRSGAAAAAVAALVAGGVLAASTGLTALRAHENALTAQRAVAAAEAARPGPRSAYALQTQVLLQVPPLMDFAVGRAAMDPAAGSATPMTPTHRIFENYQLQDPWTLALARFDMAFLVSVVAPLVLLVLCAGATAEDRRTGRLRLLVAQGARLDRLLLARVLARTALVAAVLLPILLLQGQLGGGYAGERGLAMLSFALVSLLGLGFWAAAAVFVDACFRSAASAAAALLGLWIVFAIVAPGVVAAAAQLASPAPSRLAFLAEARGEEMEALQQAAELRGAYFNDHPELETGEFDQAAWALDRWVIAQRVETAVAPSRDRFARALALQAAIADVLQLVSPTLAQHLAFTGIAGTSTRDGLAQRLAAESAVEGFRQRLASDVLAGNRMPAEAAAALASLEVPAENATPWPSILGVFLWGLGAVLLGRRALARLALSETE